MGRAFENKDAKELINKYKEILRYLEQISNYHKVKAVEVEKCFFTLEKDKYFNDIATKEIENKSTNFPSEKMKELLLHINQYILGKTTATNALELIKKLKKEIDDDISLLNKGSNSLLRIFMSSNKKSSIDDAYNRLIEYNNSFTMHEYKYTVDSIERINKLSVEEAQDDFNDNKEKYENSIKQIITYEDREPLLPYISKLTNKISAFDKKIAKIHEEESNHDKKIKEAIERLLITELINFLKTIPVEEFSKQKKGIRVKSLLDAGYTTMADIYAANHYTLTSVYGISDDIAYTIKRLVGEIAETAIKGIKIKLSYDNRNKDADNLVKVIHNYKSKKDYIKIIDQVKNRYDSSVYEAKNNLVGVGSGRYWAFSSDEYKERIKEYYNALNSLLQGEYGTVIKKTLDQYKSATVDNTVDNAWEDFNKNPIEYYNIIEEVSPGVFDSNDSIYGLPEELAREIQDECFFPDGLLCTLRRYQEWGVKYILHQERVLLGDEMGLGKTIQAIATMVSLKNTGASHFLVVCPASVVSNWCREIRKHSRLTAYLAHGSSKKSVANAWKKNGGVAVTSFESTSAFELDDTFRFSQLIVDEAHYIKNRSANRTERTIQISKHAERVLFMTGTALENNVDEMISLIDILRPDIANELTSISFLSTAPQFREKIAPVYYRRKREDVLTELPELIINEEWCTMTPVEESAYEDSVLNDHYMTVRRLSWNIDDLSMSSKMNRLKEIVEDARNDGRKIIVFSYFLDTIHKVYETLGPKICVNPINGSLNPKRRQEIIDGFNEASAGTVLCSQIQSGGTGLNIQAASVVIICEPQFKPSIENQAISRAYRMGQSRNVQVFKLLCEDTIDERIMEILKAKQEEFDAFADKSVAAKEVEIDDTTIGDIIKEEIERINKKRGNVVKEELPQIEKWDKASVK